MPLSHLTKFTPYQYVFKFTDCLKDVFLQLIDLDRDANEVHTLCLVVRSVSSHLQLFFSSHAIDLQEKTSHLSPRMSHILDLADCFMLSFYLYLCPLYSYKSVGRDRGSIRSMFNFLTYSWCQVLSIAHFEAHTVRLAIFLVILRLELIRRFRYYQRDPPL